MAQCDYGKLAVNPIPNMYSVDYNLVFLFVFRNITPYIIKYGKHPVTGAPLKQQDLIPLNFHKNSEG
jgi:hypothetical protein